MLAHKYLTNRRQFCGSLENMAPEFLRKQQSGAIKSDVWSTGVIFYELATGRLPFYSTARNEKNDNGVNEYELELARSILYKSAPLEKINRNGLTEGLKTLIGGMLKKDPANRPEPMAIVKQVLALMDTLSNHSDPRPAH